MSQDRISGQVQVTKILAKYLDSLNLTDNKDLSKKLDEGGFCVGFSICHATMDMLGDGDWWEHALIEIANWNEAPAGLSKKISLPGAREKEPVELQKIMERVINYVVYNQASTKKLGDFVISGLNQDNILEPNAGYFEVVDEGIQGIKDRRMIAGNFSKERIGKLLDEKNIEGNICIIHGSGHAIRVGYQNNKWIIYDPNYDHRSSATIHKEFSNKNDMINELTRIMGQSISIEIASFKNNKILLPKINEMDADEIKNCIKRDGLQLIARFTPEQIPYLLDKAETSKEMADNILQALSSLSSEAPGTVRSGLHSMLTLPPQYFERMLNIIGKSEPDVTKIEKMLTTKSRGTWTGFDQLLFERNLKFFDKVLDIIANNQKTLDNLSKLLSSPRKGGFIVFHNFVQDAPKQLIRFMDLIGQSEKGSQHLAKALWLSDADKTTGLQALIKALPDQIPHTLDIASRSEKGLHFVTRAIFKKGEKGLSGFQMILNDTPQHLGSVLETISRSEQGEQELINFITNNKDTLNIINKHAPNQIPIVLNIFEKYHKTIELENINTRAPQISDQFISVNSTDQLKQKTHNTQAILNTLSSHDDKSILTKKREIDLSFTKLKHAIEELNLNLNIKINTSTTETFGLHIHIVDHSSIELSALTKTLEEIGIRTQIKNNGNKELLEITDLDSGILLKEQFSKNLKNSYSKYLILAEGKSPKQDNKQINFSAEADTNTKNIFQEQDSKIEARQQTDRRPSYSRPKKFIDEGNIKLIEKELINDGWKVSDKRIDYSDKAPYQTVFDKENNSKFNIHVNKLTTHEDNLDTFIAMLKSFKAVHDNMSLPNIITHSETTKELWKKAWNTIYKEKELNLDKFITVRSPEENKPIEQSPISEKTPYNRSLK